ncbi:hypothetical protein FXO37_13625 [Capsicum annuum]|nr:hypothetical protein FXO37_13625 [Capsicum annuum]
MVQKVTDTMGVHSSESTKLATYQLQDVAHTWFKKWKADRAADTGPIEWKEFATTFLDRVFPLELSEDKVLEFINLKSKISKFVSDVSNNVVKECKIAIQIKEMDLDTSGLVATLIADRDVETMLCLNLEDVYHLQTVKKQILPLANVTAQLAGKKFNIEAKKPYAKSTDTGTPKLIIVSFVENEPSLNTESIGKRKMYETDMTTSSNYMSGRSHHKNNTEVKILDVKSYHKVVYIDLQCCKAVFNCNIQNLEVKPEVQLPWCLGKQAMNQILEQHIWSYPSVCEEFNMLSIPRLPLEPDLTLSPA